MLYPIYNTDERRVEWVTDNLETVYEDAQSLRHLPTYSTLVFQIEMGQAIHIHEIEDNPVDSNDVQQATVRAV